MKKTITSIIFFTFFIQSTFRSSSHDSLEHKRFTVSVTQEPIKFSLSALALPFLLRKKDSSDIETQNSNYHEKLRTKIESEEHQLQWYITTATIQATNINSLSSDEKKQFHSIISMIEITKHECTLKQDLHAKLETLQRRVQLQSELLDKIKEYNSQKELILSSHLQTTLPRSQQQYSL